MRAAIEEPGVSVATAIGAAGGGRRRLAFCFGFVVGGRRCAVALRFGAFFCLAVDFFLRGGLVVVLEVGGVPARTLELETRRRDELRQRVLLAGRANREGRLRKLLQHLVLAAARRAAVFVDGHAVPRQDLGVK